MGPTSRLDPTQLDFYVEKTGGPVTKPEFNDDHELDRGRDHELTILSKEDKAEIFHTRDYIRLIRYLIRDMHRNEDLNTTIGNIDKVNSKNFTRSKIFIRRFSIEKITPST